MRLRVGDAHQVAVAKCLSHRSQRLERPDQVDDEEPRASRDQRTSMLLSSVNLIRPDLPAKPPSGWVCPCTSTRPSGDAFSVPYRNAAQIVYLPGFNGAARL